jgi:hypothetical protein
MGFYKSRKEIPRQEGAQTCSVSNGDNRSACIPYMSYPVNDLVMLVYIRNGGLPQGSAEFGQFNSLCLPVKKRDPKLILQQLNRRTQALLGQKATLCRFGNALFLTNHQEIQQLPIIHEGSIAYTS